MGCPDSAEFKIKNSQKSTGSFNPIGTPKPSQRLTPVSQKSDQRNYDFKIRVNPTENNYNFGLKNEKKDLYRKYQST